MVETSHEAGGWYPNVLRPFHDIGHRIADFFAPHTDAAATGEFYEVNIELPGVSLKDINIDIHDNMMVVRGEKKTDREETGKTYFFSERTFGSFERSFRLPVNVGTDEVSANFRDGVLAIRIPKSDPAPEQTRRIEIRNG